jgi:mRNA interferase RelE/StbE
MKFQIILPKSVQKELNRLPDEIANRILARLAGLETNPRPADVKKLKGRDAWRIRVGDYWTLTRFGDRQMVQMRALRRTPPKTRKAGAIKPGAGSEKPEA